MTPESSGPTRILTTVLVAGHLATTLWHGDAHTQLAVELSPLKNVYVYVVILIAPIVGAALTWTRLAVLATWIFTLSMLGALLFGGYHHYVLVSPDNIHHLPAGTVEAQSRFVASAAVIALFDLAAALYGAFSLGAQASRNSRS